MRPNNNDFLSPHTNYSKTIDEIARIVSQPKGVNLITHIKKLMKRLEKLEKAAGNKSKSFRSL